MKKLLFLSSLLVLAGCLEAPQTGRSKSVTLLNGWQNAGVYSAVSQFKNVCRLISVNAGKLQRPIFSKNKNIWLKHCDGLASASNQKAYIENNFFAFDPYPASPDGLFTGYYQIEISASLTKSENYKYPIYGIPFNDVDLNLTRAQINNHALLGKAPILAYAHSAAELFFLHVQGSGILRLPDGSKKFIGFAAKNKHQYYSIGKYITEHQILPSTGINAKSIMKWIDANPDKGLFVMNQNPSYIFFSIKEVGATGSLGFPLIPEAAVAVDTGVLPPGLPLWIDAVDDGLTVRKMVVASDTGSAIKGIYRTDVYFGSGDVAESKASGFTGRGRYYILLPKEIDGADYF